MSPRAVVLLNVDAGAVPSEGFAAVSARVGAALADAGVGSDIQPLDGRDIAAGVRSGLLRRPDVLVVGGGDGTLSAAAEVLAGGDVPLGVLPLGTRNHFARDLGLADGLEGAARVIAAGHVRRVDVGEINGRVFLNNCSLGVYADLVRDRETQESREERRRVSATVRASWGSLRRFRVRTVTLRVDGRVWRATTPLMVVGNNRYETSLLALGRRPALEDGRLWLYLFRSASRSGIVRLLARMLLGRLEQARDFETVAATRPGAARRAGATCAWPWTASWSRWSPPSAGARGPARCRCWRRPRPREDDRPHLRPALRYARTSGVEEALLEDLHALRPSVVAVSGDLTQRARRSEFARRARLPPAPARAPGGGARQPRHPALRPAPPVPRSAGALPRVHRRGGRPLLPGRRDRAAGHQHRARERVEGGPCLGGADRRASPPAVRPAATGTSR